MVNNEKYIRWQNYTINQLTFAINLFLGLSTGSLALGVMLLRDNAFSLNGCSKLSFSLGLIALCISFIFGCIAVITRLMDFRFTAKKVRFDDKSDDKKDKISEEYRRKSEEYKRKAAILGQWTWRLFWVEIITFMFGWIVLFIVLLFAYGDKLW